MGAGHVMRCLALAQAWRHTGGAVMFASAVLTPALEERIRGEGFDLVQIAAERGSAQDLEETVAAAERLGCECVVQDGYCFDAEYQKALQGSVARLLVLDDNSECERYTASLVLNQNAYASEAMYERRSADTRLLLGARYALLRREFLELGRPAPRAADRAKNILVSLGGGDPENVSASVLEALRRTRLRDINVRVICGPSNPNLEALQSEAELPFACEVLTGVSMPQAMAWADLAITGAGATCWETAFMGLPSCVVVMAENQVRVAVTLARIGVAECAVDASQLDTGVLADRVARLAADGERRSAMSKRGRELVDGRGAERVCRYLRRERLRLRKVEEGDCKLLWEWANDRVVRTSSFTPQPIPWNEHVQWFGRRLTDPHCIMFVGLDEEMKLVGQARVEPGADQQLEVDITVAPSQRGRGYGALLIDEAARQVFAETGSRTLHALIRPENEASRKAFERGGFTRRGERTVKGITAMHYVREQLNGNQ